VKTFKQLDTAQAWEKIRHYCSWQERCHSEVMEKLKEFGMDLAESEQLVSRLIEENYLNEERFATMYAGGHFRIKKWGKVKIAHALRQKGVSAFCIKKALSEIEPGHYAELVSKLASEKWKTLKGGQDRLRQYKCKQYLLQKGFESGIIDEALKPLISKE
jgi:regulatory protein